MSRSSQQFQISRAPQESKLRSFFTLIIIGVGAVLMAFFLNLFVFQSYFVDGESMSPALHTNDRLIVSKVERSLAKISSKDYVPNRGDIIVINGNASPSTAIQAPELIKRVVAIPGDTVDITGGVVTISTSDGAVFDVDEQLDLNVDPTYVDMDISIKVTEGNVFVLGDNRTQGGSLDSRVFGLVSTDYIDGRLWARIMPFSDRRVF